MHDDDDFVAYTGEVEASQGSMGGEILPASPEAWRFNVGVNLLVFAANVAHALSQLFLNFAADIQSRSIWQRQKDDAKSMEAMLNGES